jgi:hypothetical protein
MIQCGSTVNGSTAACAEPCGQACGLPVDKLFTTQDIGGTKRENVADADL